MFSVRVSKNVSEFTPVGADGICLNHRNEMTTEPKIKIISTNT